MKIRTWIRLTGFVLIATVMIASSSPAQVSKRGKPQQKKWFTARVISTGPFMLEYMEGWSRRPISIATNPQSTLEDVSRFAFGDIIGGEMCTPWLTACPPAVNVFRPEDGRPFPPDVAINLKRLGDEYKVKYRNRGFLLSYWHSEKNIVRSLSISRDGLIILGTDVSGEIRRRLSKTELAAIEKAFFDSRTDTIESSKTDEHSKTVLTTAFGKYRDLRVDESSKKEVPFFSLLDELIQKQLRGATYRINYRWRYLIKDWKHGDTLPLDKAGDTRYLIEHWETLSKMKVPKPLWNEARDRYGEGSINLHYYRYKGKIYSVQFPICSDSPTGSWACYRIAELGKPLEDGRVWMSFEDWPNDLRIRLKDIPRNGLLNNSRLFGKGLSIPRSDVKNHRQFFERFFHGGSSYREGEYIYSGIKVWFQ